MGLFFLFKQKTAYDVRISYWSSDVCSSDLFPGNSGRGCVAANRPSSSPGFLTNRLSPPASSEWRCSSPPSSACSWSSRSFSSSGTDSARGRRDLPAFRLPSAPSSARGLPAGDRKGAVLGKRVSVRVDIGGRRILKKKNDEALI